MHVLRFAKRRKKLTAVVALVVAGSAIGVAVAAWSTGGTGSGQAQAGSAASLTISAGTPSSSLYPMGSADVAASIGNASNPFKVHVDSIALGSVTVDAGHSSCNTSSVSVTTPQTNGGTGWDVAAGGNLAVHLANAISMDNNANDSCQGATFTVALTATGASAP